MKGDNHVRWLSLMLFEKKHRKRLLSGVPISKIKYARIVKTQDKNPEFWKFFNELVEEGIMIEMEDGKFLIEPELAFQKIIENEWAEIFVKVIEERYKWGLK